MKNLLSYSNSPSTQFVYKSSANQPFLVGKTNLPNLAMASLQPRPVRATTESTHKTQHCYVTVNNSEKRVKVGRFLKRWRGVSLG